MKLTVLGSSDAFNSMARCHSSYLIRDTIAGQLRTLAIDFGATSLFALKRAGYEPKDLDGVLITHLHGDHFGGLPFLILDAMYQEPRQHPLPLLGPHLLEQRLGRLFDVLYPDVWSRKRSFETPHLPLSPGQTQTIAGFEVEGFLASHMPHPELPLCLRVRNPETGKVIAFSGDTELCEGFLQASQHADLLVAECSGMRPPAGTHLTWEDWLNLFEGKLAPHLTRRIVLTHLSTGVRSHISTLLTHIPTDFSVCFADDGLELTI